jgi:glycosyltransferase involved in cell wall biosynthesis
MKFAIVTVSYNAAATLADTLESVRRQVGVEIEHWVIDGGSTDNTAMVIERHGQHLAGYVSESDKGLYDAMNKGASLARGDVLGFLNADDWYAAPDTLRCVSSAFAQGADLVYGDLVLTTPRLPFEVKRTWRDDVHVPEDFFRRGWQPAHPATFVRRDLFRALGGFDLRWRISADYGWLAHAMQHPGLRLRHVAKTLVNMRLGGASTAGPLAIWRANRECAQVLRELGRWPWATITMKTARKLPQLLNARLPTTAKPLWRPWAE